MDWKYCVVGNIIGNHYDNAGILRIGTPAFKPGAKVYLCGKYWKETDEKIDVLGLTRGRRYQVISIAPYLIENVRVKRTYALKVLEIMNNFEFADCWWNQSEQDKIETQAFADKWNKLFRDDYQQEK